MADDDFDGRRPDSADDGDSGFTMYPPGDGDAGHAADAFADPFAEPAAAPPSPPPPGDPPDAPPERRRVFVAVSVPGRRKSWLMSLARQFHLDVWDDSLLSQRAVEQMEMAAALLLAILVFEFTMWTLLFNTIVQVSPWTVGRLTTVAAVLGGLFAGAVFVYEKSLITTDFTGRWTLRTPWFTLRFSWLAWLLTIALRLALIGLSAATTAQPFELIIFGGQIEGRLKDETVNAEALRQLRLQNEEKKLAQGTPFAQLEDAVDDTNAGTDKVEAEQRFEAAAREHADAVTAVARANRELGNARASVKERQQALAVQRRGGDPDQIIAADRALSFAEQRLARAETQAATAVNTQNEKARVLATADARRKSTSDVYEREKQRVLDDDKLKTDDYKRRVELRKTWMDTVQAARFGQAITNPITNSQLEWHTSDFVDRLHIIEDIRTGQPPRWPPSSDDDKKAAIATFQLPNVLEGQIDPRAEARREATDRVYWISYAIACFIPFLTVGFKFLLIGEELKTYYDLRAQARAGHPDAIATLEARRYGHDYDTRD
jgi:hypothetical protein